MEPIGDTLHLADTSLQLALWTFFFFFAGLNGNKFSGSSTILEKYKVGKVIGDGNFAVVKECVER